MSTNHDVKEEVDKQVWGIMNPSTRETHALQVKLVEQMLDIVTLRKN